MHYVVFLAERGLTPYREIADINLPGTYAAGWLAMHLFGDGPLAWRLYDLVLGLTAAIAMAVIAWPYDRLAGIFAGALFVLIHGRDGMAELGQRDLLMTVLLLWAVALTLCALRRRRLFFIPLAGALAGFAFTIKPPRSSSGLQLSDLLLCYKSHEKNLPFCLRVGAQSFRAWVRTRPITHQSAKGAIYTSLGRSPRYRRAQKLKGLKARSIDFCFSLTLLSSGLFFPHPQTRFTPKTP